jgi:hypothetical protein
MKDKMSTRKHIAKSGKQQGQWVNCPAGTKCRNGGMHIDDATLQATRLWRNEGQKGYVTLKSLNKTDVENFLKLPTGKQIEMKEGFEQKRKEQQERLNSPEAREKSQERFLKSDAYKSMRKWLDNKNIKEKQASLLFSASMVIAAYKEGTFMPSRNPKYKAALAHFKEQTKEAPYVTQALTEYIEKNQEVSLFSKALPVLEMKCYAADLKAGVPLGTNRENYKGLKGTKPLFDVQKFLVSPEEIEITKASKTATPSLKVIPSSQRTPKPKKTAFDKIKDFLDIKVTEI